MQFTDSHLHLQDYKTNNAQQIVADLRRLGFVRVVCASSSASSWKEVASLAVKWPDLIIPAFGLHPWYLKAAPADWLDIVRSYLKEFPSAWVGECGLDRLKAPGEEGQLEVFKEQIKLAEEFNRPLNIHALKAAGWLTDLWPRMPERFMLHSFGGSIGFLRSALKAGARISLSASILKHKNYADVIREVPLSKLLLESDGPFLSDYKDIPEFARKIAELKKIDYAGLVECVYANFKEFNGGE